MGGGGSDLICGYIQPLSTDAASALTVLSLRRQWKWQWRLYHTSNSRI